MIHNITAGHFDREATGNGSAAVSRPIEMHVVRRLLGELGDIGPEGVPILGGWKVRFENGCVILPWKGGATNRVAEEFAIRLHQATGCTQADREHGRIIDPAESVGLEPENAAWRTRQ